MSAPKRPTLQTIASALGVSRSTVSNAYNRPDQLSPELREQILSTAASLGYAGPDPTARSLRQGTAGAIGLLQDVLWAVTDPANLLMLAGVAEVCEERGLALVLLGARADGDEDRPSPLRQARLDGIIAHCEALSEADRLHLEHSGVAKVSVDNDLGVDVPSVSIDEEHGAREAAHHLAALGHRRIAILSITDGDHSDQVARRRLAGYLEALTRAGIDESTIITVPAGWSRATGHDALAPLLAGPARPTAVLAMSDELALGAFDAAHEAGLEIPHDLSVVGFDDAPTAAVARPPLTTVHQDHREKGRTAARLLLGELGAFQSVVLPTRLVIRGSTAAAER